MSANIGHYYTVVGCATKLGTPESIRIGDGSIRIDDGALLMSSASRLMNVSGLIVAI
jgi:hypothetical protein